MRNSDDVPGTKESKINIAPGMHWNGIVNLEYQIKFEIMVHLLRAARERCVAHLPVSDDLLTSWQTWFNPEMEKQTQSSIQQTRDCCWARHLPESCPQKIERMLPEWNLTEVVLCSSSAQHSLNFLFNPLHYGRYKINQKPPHLSSTDIRTIIAVK